MQTLVQAVFPPRMLGFLLAALITVSSVQSLWQCPWTLGLVLVCLGYPLFMLHGQKRSTSHWVRNGMLLDAALVSLLILANQFYWFASLAFLLFLTLSAGIISGVLGGLRAFAVAVLLTIPFMDRERVMLEAGPAVNLTIAISLFVFVGFIARLVYEETGQLYGLRKIAKDTEARLKREGEYLGRYVSPKLVSVIRSKPRAPAQRRRLTICFTDLSGFTALMDRMPEHKMTEVLNEYLDAMAEIALDHGGTVDKFMGDGLMVFFGDPESTGARGDAEACLDMALAMTARLEHLSHDWSMKGLKSDLKMRVGVHTGYCAVGNFGADSHMNYTAIGGAVNIASRLENAAPRGGVLVSASTARLLSNRYRLAPFDLYRLKGIREPVKCARLLGHSQDTDRETSISDAVK